MLSLAVCAAGSFVCAAAPDKPVPPPPVVVTLTFDDGAKGHLSEVAELLGKYKLPAAFNIITDTIGKSGHLTWGDVRELYARGYEITSHTVSHPNLADLVRNGMAEEARREIVDSRDAIVRELGTAPRFFCHPYVAGGPAVDSIVRACDLVPMGYNRRNFGGETVPGTPTSLGTFLDDLYARQGAPQDILFHGVSPTSGGWNPMTNATYFAKSIEELWKRVQQRKVRVVSYEEFDRISKNLDITKTWLVQPVAVPEGQTLEKEIPYDKKGLWTTNDFSGSIPLMPDVKKAEPWSTPYNAWYRKDVFVPAKWKGSSVRFERFLWWCELSVFVNGKKAGVVHRPQGGVELAPFLKFGATNRIEIFATNGGYGTGEGPVAYRGRGDMQTNMKHFDGFHVTIPNPALLVRRSAVHMEDYQLITSWREKKLIARLEIDSAVSADLEAEIEISDDAGRDARKRLRTGKIVKTVKEKIAVKPGFNKIDVVIPWADVTPWEAIENPKLYNSFVRLTRLGGKGLGNLFGLLSDDADSVCDVPEKKLFGFREVWRDGNKIMMNGHVQHFRGAWGVRSTTESRQAHAYGHNLAYATHQHAPVVKFDYEPYTRAGQAMFTATPTIYYVHDDIRKDKWCSIQFERHVDFWLKSARNAPCVVGASVGVNQICPERNMRPEMLGIVPESSGVVKNIEYACDVARKRNPGVLYFSHADGTEADLSSSNFYPNWTPLQEREEWLSDWSKKGILPWYAAEFASPYQGCWYHLGSPEVTEWLAIQYGEKAYEKEPDEFLGMIQAYAEKAAFQPHGVQIGGKGPNERHPLAEDYSRRLVYRTNRSWRAYGLNGGLMYLINWDWSADGDVLRERQALAAGQICAFIGGAGDHADRTHAYRDGETVKKDFILIWDGPGENTFRVTWRLVDPATKMIATSGQTTVTLRSGEIRKVPFEVKVPALAYGQAQADWRIEAFFDADGMNTDYPANLTCRTDSFDLRVYPAALPAIRPLRAGQLALFDPEGDTAKLFDAMSIVYARIDALTNALAPKAAYTHLVVGRHALDRAEGLEASVPKIAEKGFRVMVMPQSADVMESLGLKVEDTMSRELYNASIAGIDDKDLAYWGGAPLADAPTGPVMKHKTRRGPRWTHRHAIASMPILLPARAGWTVLVRGEFDMSYAGVLRARAGKGDVTFVALDFEGRCGSAGCPAATRVFAKTFEDFCFHANANPLKVYADGAHAARLAARLGVEAEPLPAEGPVKNAFVLLGKDSKLDAKTLAARLGPNARYNVVANEAFAASAGFGLTKEETVKRTWDAKENKWTEKAEPKRIYRFTPNVARYGNRTFEGVSRAWLRDRAGVVAAKLEKTDAVKAWLIEDNGLFASSGSGVIEMIDPFGGADELRPEGGKVAGNNRWGGAMGGVQDVLFRSAVQSEENHLRRWAHRLAAQGVYASTNLLARALYTKPKVQFEPIAEYNYLGPWPYNMDDSHYLIDTTDFPVDPKAGGDSGAEAERMAIAGDTQPNPRFHPLGLEYPADRAPHDRFLDWRPTVRPKPDGMVDLREIPLLAAQSFQTTYLVGYLEREKAGEVTVRFGVDWRGKVWVNGEEIVKTYAGPKDPASIIVEKVPLKAGKNVFTVKAGSGQAGCFFYLDVTKETKSTDVSRHAVPALDDVDVYETDNPVFDPYVFVYW